MKVVHGVAAQKSSLSSRIGWHGGCSLVDRREKGAVGWIRKDVQVFGKGVERVCRLAVRDSGLENETNRFFERAVSDRQQKGKIRQTKANMNIDQDTQDMDCFSVLSLFLSNDLETLKGVSFSSVTI